MGALDRRGFANDAGDAHLRLPGGHEEAVDKLVWASLKAEMCFLELTESSCFFMFSENNF